MRPSFDNATALVIVDVRKTIADDLVARKGVDLDRDLVGHRS